MVLERLLTIREAVKKPWWVFVISGFITLVSLSVSSLFFPRYIGLFNVFFITLAMFPFMVRLSFYENEMEEKVITYRKNFGFLYVHKAAILIYTSFFLGVTFTLALAYLFLPSEVVESIFKEQIEEINLIRGSVSFGGTLVTILVNNLGVLLLVFIFSLLYGAGAIFILSWNASVLAAAIGMSAKQLGGVRALPIAILIYLPHGVWEITGYFLAAIAGGIVSAEISRKKSKWLSFVFEDALYLLLIAVFLLFVGACIESFSIAKS